MNFIRTKWSRLMAIGTRGAYAGGSNHTDLEDFMSYIIGKDSFGTGEPGDFHYCYYFRTANALEAEDRLLARGFEYNIQTLSNLQEGPGFAYVCTKGERVFLRLTKR